MRKGVAVSRGGWEKPHLPLTCGTGRFGCLEVEVVLGPR